MTIDSRLQEARVLLVQAGAGSYPSTNGVGDGAPGLRARRWRRPSTVAARRRFHRAITFVNALSSTDSWYSSGPITPSICARPSTVVPHPRRPVPGGLHQEVPYLPRRERRVPGPIEVARGRPRDIGDDVLLEFARVDRNDTTGRQPRMPGVTSIPSAADSHGKRAPARPRRAAAARAAPRRRPRYSSIARAAAGWVAARNGRTKTSLSQNTCPR